MTNNVEFMKIHTENIAWHRHRVPYFKVVLDIICFKLPKHEKIHVGRVICIEMQFLPSPIPKSTTLWSILRL